MAERFVIDPKKQFSKRLARWTAVFWFVYMTWLSVIMILTPQAALYTVYMALIVTAVMIVNVYAYTRNSIYEKMMFAMLDKARIEVSLKNSARREDDTNDSGGDEPDEGVSNG